MEYTSGIIKQTEFFTTAELAEKLKMNVQVITRKLQAGEIEAYKIGKEWRIPEQSVYDWLQKNVNAKRRKKKQSQQRPAAPDNGPSGQPQSSNPRRKDILEFILAQFEPNREYSEAEVNRIIGRYDRDTDAVRHQFVQEAMLEHDNGQYRRRSDYRFVD